jgi:hypothetical protein
MRTQQSSVCDSDMEKRCWGFPSSQKEANIKKRMNKKYCIMFFAILQKNTEATRTFFLSRAMNRHIRKENVKKTYWKSGKILFFMAANSDNSFVRLSTLVNVTKPEK